jgi:hypothetical protein
VVIRRLVYQFPLSIHYGLNVSYDLKQIVKCRRHSKIGYLSLIDYERWHYAIIAVPGDSQPAVVLAAVKDKPCGRPEDEPSLTAARDRCTRMRAGTKKWLSRGPREKMPCHHLS